MKASRSRGSEPQSAPPNPGLSSHTNVELNASCAPDCPRKLSVFPRRCDDSATRRLVSAPST